MPFCKLKINQTFLSLRNQNPPLTAVKSANLATDDGNHIIITTALNTYTSLSTMFALEIAKKLSNKASISDALSKLSLATTKNCSRQLSSVKTDEREVVAYLGLNNLRDNDGAVKTRRRVGRGIGSSKGKTCGRGHKGQKARAGGGVSPLFEGGQTKFYKRIPKRGFKNRHAEPMVPINVGTLQDYIDMGRLVPSDQPWTIKDLIDSGVTTCSSVKHGVKLLAKGKERLRTPFKIEISRASEGAIDAIEKVGGEITTVHYNRLALRALLKPEKFDIIPKRAGPPPKLMQYYTDYDKRGYLSPEVQLRKLKEGFEKNEEIEVSENRE